MFDNLKSLILGAAVVVPLIAAIIWWPAYVAFLLVGLFVALIAWAIGDLIRKVL